MVGLLQWLPWWLYSFTLVKRWNAFSSHWHHSFWCRFCGVLQCLKGDCNHLSAPPPRRTTADTPTVSRVKMDVCAVGKVGIQCTVGSRCSPPSHGHLRTQLHPELWSMSPSLWITKCYSEKHISLIWRQWMLVWFIQRHYLRKLVLGKVMGGDFNTNTVISPRHLGYNYKPYMLLQTNLLKAALEKQNRTYFVKIANRHLLEKWKWLS